MEKYVLGLADEQEKVEFEQACARYPELVAARTAFEKKLEQFSMQQGVTPPAAVRDSVMRNIRDEGKGDKKEGRVVPLANGKGSRGNPSGILRFMAAASTVLVIAFAWMYMQTRSRNQSQAEEMARLRHELDAKDTALTRVVKEMQDVVSNPNVTMVNMVGTRIAPHSSANVFWDSTSQNVWLVVKNMPKLPSDEQYQLWALIDKEKKDLGVFDAADRNVILKMKNSQKAQAFAITIEQKGGAAHPNLDSLQSVGKMTLID
jgi:anti-sigma-K factor RskA